MQVVEGNSLSLGNEVETTSHTFNNHFEQHVPDCYLYKVSICATPKMKRNTKVMVGQSKVREQS